MPSSLLQHSPACRGLHSRCLPAGVPRAAPRRASALAALDTAALGSAHAVEALSQVHSELEACIYFLQAQQCAGSALLSLACVVEQVADGTLALAPTAFGALGAVGLVGAVLVATDPQRRCSHLHALRLLERHHLGPLAPTSKVLTLACGVGQAERADDYDRR